MSCPRRWTGILLLTLAALAGGACADAPPPAEEMPVSEEAHEDEHDRAAPALVTLGPRAHEEAGIETVVVGAADVQAHVGLVVPGHVEFDPRRVTLITPRSAGRVERLSVVSGDHVREGQVVALLYSPAWLVAQEDYALAAARARRSIGTPAATDAEAIASAARRRLEVLGATEAEVAGLARGEPVQPWLPVRAPFAGSILEAEAVTGMTVEVGDPLFRLADLSHVDVIAQVPERALPLVRVGQAATVELVAYPGLSFSGHLERLRGELSDETRTVAAAIHVPNPEGRLRPGMYATVRIETDPAELPSSGPVPADTTRALVIPESAVLADGDEQVVFVAVAPRTWERRVVQVTRLTPPGSTVPSTAVVRVDAGLAPGDRVVTRGAFTLKSELAKGELGDHGH